MFSGGSLSKRGARELVEEHFILGIEEVAPALGEVIKECALMHEQLVVTLIETMLFGEREVAAEQVRDGRVIEPMPVQPPFRTWINEAIKHQRLQHQIPASAFAACRQTITPEGIKAKLPPEFATQPASTPLTRLAQRA